MINIKLGQSQYNNTIIILHLILIHIIYIVSYVIVCVCVCIYSNYAVYAIMVPINSYYIIVMNS